MKALGRIGLGGRLLAIVLAVISIDFVVNSVLFESARLYEIREDEASGMAEHVIVAHRLIERAKLEERPQIARQLDTERFTVTWSENRIPTGSTIELSTLRRQMFEAESELRGLQLQLKLMPLSSGGAIGGSTVLKDGTAINFRFNQAVWSLNLGRILALALPSVLLVLLAWLLFRIMLKPLRSLVQATSTVGVGDPQPLKESGQGDVLQLIRAFNAMRERIHQLLASQSQTLLAIGHDLRTPLARLQLRIEGAGIPSDLRDEIGQDIDEMRALLQSLQTFVESGKDDGPIEPIDLAVTARTLVDNARDRGARATYRGPLHLEVITRPVAVRRALSNLVENAVAYAGHARVELVDDRDRVEIIVDDDGPGVPPEHMHELLNPFFRLDNARTRNTPGMGLGLPIVDRVVTALGGTLDLFNKPSGGFRVTIRIPVEPA